MFGWKKLPDAARSLGRSMRIFKAEVDEMKREPNPASRDTVEGKVSKPGQPASQPSSQPSDEAQYERPAEHAETPSTGSTAADAQSTGNADNRS